MRSDTAPTEEDAAEIAAREDETEANEAATNAADDADMPGKDGTGEASDSIADDATTPAITPESLADETDKPSA